MFKYFRLIDNYDVFNFILFVSYILFWKLNLLWIYKVNKLILF